MNEFKIISKDFSNISSGLTLQSSPADPEKLIFVSDIELEKEINIYLRKISESVRLEYPSWPFDVSSNVSLHYNIVRFLNCIADLTNIYRGADYEFDKSDIIFMKAREYTIYLNEKCLKTGVNHPAYWKDGIFIDNDVHPIFDYIYKIGRRFDVGRKKARKIDIAKAVAEQIIHVYNLCVDELPKRRNLIERKRPEALVIEDPAEYVIERPKIRCWYQPNKEIQVDASVKFQDLSSKGNFKGELPSFLSRIDGNGRLLERDAIVYRIPLDPDTIWDPDFATVYAATVDTDNRNAILEFRLGIGDDAGLANERSSNQEGLLHLSGAWRFLVRPINPYLQIKIILKTTQSPVDVVVSLLFAGHDFDPYVFNPYYERIANVSGRPTFPGGDEILKQFTSKARQAAVNGQFIAAQAFLAPFLVVREGNPKVRMLVGTANSLFWYGAESSHGIECYQDWGCVSEGDIIFDCGGHAGQMAAYFSIVAGPRGRVISFDPFLQNCMQIEAQDKLNCPGRIRAIQAGVGARRQKLRVSNLSQMTTSSPSSPADGFTEIEIVPLDDFFDEAPTFIKLDVEGAEVDALIGAAQVLRAFKPKLFVEVHTQLIGQFGHDLTAFFAAIPSDIYNIKFMAEGVDHDWRDYAPGLEIGITVPLLVLATAKISEVFIYNT